MKLFFQEEKITRTESVIILILVAFLIFSTRGFNMLGWSIIVPRKYYVFAAWVLVIVFLILMYNDKTRNIPSFIYKYVIFLCLWPVIPLFINIANGGDPYTAFGRLFGWTSLAVFFFVFEHFKIREIILISSLAIFASITACIQIFEQFISDPDSIIFGARVLEDETIYIATRNDYYRLYVGCAKIQLFVFLYFWTKLIKNKSMSLFFLTALLGISIYLYLTKQIMISAAIACLFSVWYIQRKRNGFSPFLLLLLLGGVITLNWDSLFGGLVHDYAQDTYSTDIRFKFISWISDYFQQHPVKFLFGQGYNQEYEMSLASKYQYYLGDIGFIGETFYLGIVWVVVYFAYLFNIFIRIKDVPSYIVLFYLATLVMCVFIFPYRDMAEMFVWICSIYIISKNIETKQVLRLKNKKLR